MKCDWRLFLATSKVCAECDDYAACRSEHTQAQNDRYKNARNMGMQFTTNGSIDDDAIQYMEFLRVYDNLILSSTSLEDMQSLLSDEEEDKQKEKPVLKSEKMLHPIMDFLDSENIPYKFSEPNDVFAASFMMISSLKDTNKYTVRLTSTRGLSSTIKFSNRVYKGSNNRTYKYVKTGLLDEVFPIIKNVVYLKKSNAT